MIMAADGGDGGDGGDGITEVCCLIPEINLQAAGSKKQSCCSFSSPPPVNTDGGAQPLALHPHRWGQQDLRGGPAWGGGAWEGVEWRWWGSFSSICTAFSDGDGDVLHHTAAEAGWS